MSKEIELDLQDFSDESLEGLGPVILSDRSKDPGAVHVLSQRADTSYRIRVISDPGFEGVIRAVEAGNERLGEVSACDNRGNHRKLKIYRAPVGNPDVPKGLIAHQLLKIANILEGQLLEEKTKTLWVKV